MVLNMERGYETAKEVGERFLEKIKSVLEKRGLKEGVHYKAKINAPLGKFFRIEIVPKDLKSLCSILMGKYRKKSYGEECTIVFEDTHRVIADYDRYRERTKLSLDFHLYHIHDLFKIFNVNKDEFIEMLEPYLDSIEITKEEEGILSLGGHGSPLFIRVRIDKDGGSIRTEGKIHVIRKYPHNLVIGSYKE